MQKEDLEKQYLQHRPFTSLFGAAAVRNVIPDPDVPESCAESAEYVIKKKLLLLIIAQDNLCYFTLKSE
jgi:hypothetical protein